jgi:hypothetical protein
MSVEKSLKQIIYEVSEIEKAHKQTRSFHFGDLLDIIKKGKIDYASIFMSVNNATTDKNFTTLTVELYAFDILAQDDANRVDVENTTQQILDDFITIIRYSTRWNNFCEVDSSVPERKFYDTLQDRLSGWSATIQIKVYRNDCLVGLPIDDYDFNQHGNFEAVVFAIVKNTANTILATKLVSDSDDTIIIPNITVTDSDGSTYSQPSGVNVVCTAGGGAGDIDINGVNIGTYTAPNTFALDVTLDGLNSGSWNAGTQTWEVVSTPCADATVTVNGEEFGTVASGGTLAITVQSTDEVPLGSLTDPNIWTIPDIDLNVNDVTIGTLPAGFDANIYVVDQTNTQIGSYNGIAWVVINPIRGNFQANRGVLDTFVIDSSSAGVYTGTTNDGASGTITILVNGNPISFPQTLAIGDLLDVSRTTTTSIGWYQLNG